jgi:F-box domain
MTRPFLSSLASILSRRGILLDRAAASIVAITATATTNRASHEDTNACSDDANKNGCGSSSSSSGGSSITDFWPYMAQLSILYDKTTDWLGHDDDHNDDDLHTATTTTTTATAAAPVEERHTIIQALQWAGILGICSHDVYDDNEDNKDRVESDDSDSEKDASKHQFPSSSAVETSTREQRGSFFLPFPTDHSIRDAAVQWNGDRHDDKLQVLSLLSACSPTNSYPPAMYDDCTDSANDIIDEVTPAPPAIMDHLHDDMLEHVFAFLGYKRLLRMRLVSTEWKHIADHPRLWYQLYRTRFGFVEKKHTVDDTTTNNNNNSADQLPNENEPVWKQFFMERWLAEREIRFQYHRKSDWKVRLCRHLGCLQVLKSPLQERRHDSKHERQAQEKKKKKTQVGRAKRKWQAKTKQESVSAIVVKTPRSSSSLSPKECKQTPTAKRQRKS